MFRRFNPASCVGSEHSRKEPSRRLVNCFLHMSMRVMRHYLGFGCPQREASGKRTNPDRRLVKIASVEGGLGGGHDLYFNGSCKIYNVPPGLAGAAHSQLSSTPALGTYQLCSAVFQHSKKSYQSSQVGTLPSLCASLVLLWKQMLLTKIYSAICSVSLKQRLGQGSAWLWESVGLTSTGTCLF